MVTTKPRDGKRSDLSTEVYGLADFASLIGVSYTTAHCGAQAGTLPVRPIRIGRVYKFPKAEVHKLLGLTDPAPTTDAA